MILMGDVYGPRDSPSRDKGIRASPQVVPVRPEGAVNTDIATVLLRLMALTGFCVLRDQRTFESPSIRLRH
jgi:hypothetical protein